MPAISKTCVVSLLISLLLNACGSGGSAGSDGQSTGITVLPTPTAPATPTMVVFPTSTLTGPYVANSIDPRTIEVNDIALVTVSLKNVPTEGYTSTEFTCSYNPSLFEVSNINVADLFGIDPVLAINGPHEQNVIVAIAASNGNKATTSGPAFTFNIKGLQAGQTVIECKARVSQGNNSLTSIPFVVDTLTVQESTPTPNITSSFTPLAESSTPTNTPSVTPTVPLHAAFNTHGDIAELSALGFNLFDISGSKTNPENILAVINALPEGTQALVWLGNLGNASKGQSCPTPGFSDAEFEAQVDRLANNAKVFGYNLSDEPHPSVCPDAANAIKARSDYIHTHAPEQKTYITILDGSNMCPEGEGCEYRALRPEATHVDLIGIDPYPCHFDSAGQPVACNTSMISERVQLATANGIPASAIVPVFQAFGQEGRLDGGSIYYRTPTTTEFQDMLNLWKFLVPNPFFDFAYTWGIQCTASTCPAPQSLKNHPELQLLIKQHNLAP